MTKLLSVYHKTYTEVTDIIINFLDFFVQNKHCNYIIIIICNIVFYYYHIKHGAGV